MPRKKYVRELFQEFFLDEYELRVMKKKPSYKGTRINHIPR
jgi:hypothetical protein